MNNLISLDQARVMTALYRAERDNILKPEYLGKNILLTCETFERAAYDRLLAYPGCVGVRIYFGMNEALQVKCILVGVDADNKDILPDVNPAGTTGTTSGSEGTGEEEEEPPIVELGQACPPICPTPSGLYP
jgi:hypothetical protein